jgi:hypothetical protein
MAATKALVKGTAKKAAKKVANKAAKKVAKKAAKHVPGHDLRRAYEHLGRIEILDQMLGPRSPLDIAAVVTLARQELAAEAHRNAADLLRAAEHMSFAALSPDEPAATVSSELERAVRSEFERLFARAEAQEAMAGPIGDVLTTTLDAARGAFDGGFFRPALELARAAEALTHVEPSAARLESGGGTRRLRR